jgi:hypothetical protein
MAPAVFQVVQDHTPTSEISSTKIKRGQDRSLSMTEETTSLMACLSYRKPKERHGPPRYPDPITLIRTISDQTKDETDKAWVLLRMLSRRTIELPVFTNKVQQGVPFWTGFYKLLSVHKPDFVAVGYPTIVDAKPTTNKRPFYSINCFNSEILSAIATILSLKLLELLILYCNSFFAT